MPGIPWEIETMRFLAIAFLTAFVGLQPILMPPMQAQTTTEAGLPPKGCWTQNLVWTLARQDRPVSDPTRWTVLAQLPWSSWKTGVPMQTVRGDQLLLTVTTLDNRQMLLASGPRDEPVILTRVDVLCTFTHEEPDLRIVFSTKAFR
jgi:hypothetical protein